MRIGFIGAGKVGCSLGRYFGQRNEIVGYASRTHASAEEAARLTGSTAFEDVVELARACETIFITTPDGQIAPTWKTLLTTPGAPTVLAGKNICHCSGALPSSALVGAAKVGGFVYSVHPLFAIPSKQTSLSDLSRAFFTIEGSEGHLAQMQSLIEDMGNRCQVIDAQAKTRYHAAAALASNHVVALYRLASEELVCCGFSQQAAEKALAPLFLGNAEHIAHDGVVASLTGPAERGDMATIEKHLGCLDGNTREVYRLLNETLLEIAAEKHAQTK